MHAVSFSPSGDVLAFAGKQIALVYTGKVLNTVFVKVTTVPLASSTQLLVLQSGP